MNLDRVVESTFFRRRLSFRNIFFGSRAAALQPARDVFERSHQRVLIARTFVRRSALTRRDTQIEECTGDRTQRPDLHDLHVQDLLRRQLPTDLDLTRLIKTSRVRVRFSRGQRRANLFRRNNREHAALRELGREVGR
jgi:hypothetical protein